MTLIGIGKAAAIVGGLLCLIPLVLAPRDHFAGPKDACLKSVATIPPNAGVIYTDQTELFLNSDLCLAVKAESYFAPERADVDAARLVVNSAEKEHAQVDKEAEPARSQKLPQAVANLEAARKLLVAAEVALKAKPAAKTVSLFIDEVRTPVSTELYISDPKATQDGWTWKTLKLRAPDDSDSDAGKLWRQILSGTSLEGSRQVRIGLGDSNGTLPRSDAVLDGKKVTLRVYDLGILASGAIGLGLVAAGLIAMGWNTGLLRDKPPTPTSGDPDPKSAPFSLARTQFAWWLFLGIGGFLYIWLVTGQFIGVVTSGVLTLIGISGVSGLAAQMMDSAPSTRTSRSFLMDILSEDGTSLALHRVQMAAWTLILGLIFLWTALTSFSFPKFDANLLVLAGIVNGVYLGFKFPDK